MKRPLTALSALLFAAVAQPVLADWQVVFDAEADRVMYMGGNTRRGSFATRADCEAYRSSRPLFEQRHSWCEGSDTESQSQSYQPAQKPAPPVDPFKMGDKDFKSLVPPPNVPRSAASLPVRVPYPTPVPRSGSLATPATAAGKLTPAQCEQKLKQAESEIHGRGLQYSADILRPAVPLCAGTSAHLRQQQLLGRIDQELLARRHRAAYPRQARGLIGGTTWEFKTYFRDIRPGYTPEQRTRLETEAEGRLRLAGKSQEEIDAVGGYDFVFAMAVSSKDYADLFKRVLKDNRTLGAFSGRTRPEYANLRGRSFDVLDCHSNGAMLCLYGLLSGDITARKVRLFGPQLTEEAITAWRIALDPKGFGPKLPVLEVYLADSDPVPAASLNWEDPWWERAASPVNDGPPQPAITPVVLDPVARLQSRECYMDGLLGCFDKPVPAIFRVPCPQATSTRDLTCHAFTHYAAALRRSGQ